MNQKDPLDLPVWVPKKIENAPVENKKMLLFSKLLTLFKPKKTYINFLIELQMEGLEGRKFLGKDLNITTLLTINE